MFFYYFCLLNKVFSKSVLTIDSNSFEGFRHEIRMVTKSKLTIPSLINESVKKYSDKTSLVFVGEEIYTYQQMGEDINQLADRLIELGVTKGDKIALLSGNMPNWGVAFFAISIAPEIPDRMNISPWGFISISFPAVFVWVIVPSGVIS